MKHPQRPIFFYWFCRHWSTNIRGKSIGRVFFGHPKIATWLRFFCLVLCRMSIFLCCRMWIIFSHRLSFSYPVRSCGLSFSAVPPLFSFFMLFWWRHLKKCQLFCLFLNACRRRMIYIHQYRIFPPPRIVLPLCPTYEGRDIWGKYQESRIFLGYENGH